MGQAGQAEDAEICKSKVRLCSCRWKATTHNTTIWLFLDTEGENRLYSGPKKREFLSPSPTQRLRWDPPPLMPPPT